jgi:hypothetical protein
VVQSGSRQRFQVLAAIAVAGLLCTSCGRSLSSEMATASAARTATPTPASKPTPSSPSCTAPAARTDAAVAYDSVRKQVVLFGGHGGASTKGLIFGDTWQWDGSCWHLTSTPAAPSPRAQAAIAFNSALNVLVLYGGRTASGWLDDTWTWDGTGWSLVQRSPGPGIAFPLAAFDPGIGKVVVYGFASDYSAGQTWMWDGTWNRLSPTVIPPPRAGSALAFDEASGAVLLFGGRSPDLTFMGDTWAFSGSNWRKLSPSTSPSGRQGHAMASVSGGVILLGGIARGDTLTKDTWRWNGISWQPLLTPHTPSSWGIAGMTARNGNAVVVTYSADGTGVDVNELSASDWAAR